MAKAEFTVNHGVLQEKDIYSSASGTTTTQLTNSRLVDDQEISESIIKGETKVNYSPLVMLLVVGIALAVISYMQK